MKSKPTLKPAGQFASKTVATKSTSHPMEVDSFGKGGKKGEDGGKSVKKEGQHQNPNPNSSTDVVCWCCGKKGHLSTECWSNPRKTEEHHRLGSRLVGTGRTGCIGGATTATSSCERSRLRVD